MTTLRIDEILAQTDPFDLSQGIERYVSTLDGTSIRELVAPVLSRAGKYYRNELSFLQNPTLSDDAMRKAFIRFLTSNLRAITLFGTSFSDGVLKACPQHRVVGIGEERRNIRNARAAVVFGSAVALVILGAAAEHAVSNARAAAQAPQPQAISARAPHSRGRIVPVNIARRTPAPRAQNVVAQSPQARRTFEGTTAAPVEAPTPAAAPPIVDPRAYDSQTAPVREVPMKKPPVTHGGVVNVVVATPSPTPEPTPLDVTDMPDAYSDATPLPQPSNEVAQPQTDVEISTPKPTARPRHGVFNHLDPFEPGSHFRIP